MIRNNITKRTTTVPPEGSRPNTNRKRLGAPLNSWEFYDKNGQYIGVLCKYGNGAVVGSPDYVDRYSMWSYGRRSFNLNYEWSLGGFSIPMPLYRANEIEEKKDKIVIVCADIEACDLVSQWLPEHLVITWAIRASNGDPDYFSAQLADWAQLNGRYLVFINSKGGKDQTSMAYLAWKIKNFFPSFRKGDSGTPSKMTVISLNKPLSQLAQLTTDEFRELCKKNVNAEWVNSPPPGHEDNNPDLGAPDPYYGTPDSESPAATKKYDDSALPVRYSQLALSQLWTKGDGANWRYTAEWNYWFKWDGSRWRVDKIRASNQSAKELVIKVCKETESNDEEVNESLLRSICSRDYVNSMLALASSHPYHATASNEWDRDNFLLGTPGGTVDLRTGEIYEPRKEDNITFRTLVAPVQGPTPVFDMVMARATSGDATLLKHYQKWFGYILTGDTREEAFLFIYGPGASGKSKVINAIFEIMGDYGATADISTFIDQKNQQHTENLARLHSVRMVCATETEEGKRFNESLIKKVTGRETITARFMAKNSFEYNPKFKIVIGGNFKPGLKSVGNEMQRRIHFMQFPEPIPKEQRILDLPDRLQKEYPAILYNMIQWCLLWQAEGLDKPKIVEDATQEYLDGEDSLGKWIISRCEVDNVSTCEVSSAYRAYKTYSEAAGEFVISQKRFVQQMESRGFFVTERIAPGSRTIKESVFNGFSLLFVASDHPVNPYSYNKWRQ